LRVLKLAVVNARRGLFRAWLALSAVWLVLNAPVVLYLTAGAHEPPDAAGEPDSGGATGLAPFDPRRILSTELRQERARAVEWVEEWQWPRERLVALLVVPPLLLAALLGVGFWVFRGFRDERRPSAVDPYPGP
jgi:hypothetical protein